MGRTVDQDVHAAFVEFRAKGTSFTLSLQTTSARKQKLEILLTVYLADVSTQTMTSAFPYNVSIASRSEQKTLLARSSISLSVLV